MIRTITPAEAAVVEWLLTNAGTQGAERYGADTANSQVIATCGCGCGSLDFDGTPFDGATMVADALAVVGEAELGLILWGREGRITALELVPHDPVSARTFPSVNQLRTYDQRGSELARMRSE